MRPIEFVRGDATAPQAEGAKIVAHVCNDKGRWGQGFVLAVSRRWPEAEAAYREWYEGRDRNNFGLGAVQFVQVGPDVWVANMVGQHGLTGEGSTPPIRKPATSRTLPTNANGAAVPAKQRSPCGAEDSSARKAATFPSPSPRP